MYQYREYESLNSDRRIRTNDKSSNELISEWASANILQTVARVDLESEGVLDLPKVAF